MAFPEVSGLLTESYRKVAPAALVKRLDEPSGPT